MKAAAAALLACLCALLLAFPGCNYARPMMYIGIANRSGHPLENLEIDYPAGAFGLAELRDEQTERRLVRKGTPCKFSIAFEDQAGKTYASKHDFGARCPSAIAFEVGAGMQVSQRAGRP